MAKSRQCRGCGAPLQSEEVDNSGYLPEHILNDPGKALVCQRCYRIAHYGKDQKTTITPDVACNIVKSSVDWAEAVLLVVDLMDFEGSLPPQIVELLRGKKGIALVNKGDLLPPKTTIIEARKWVEAQLGHHGLSLHTRVISGISGLGIRDLVAEILKQPYERWVVVGATSVGKSTLISTMLHQQERTAGGVPTIAKFPGTTVEKLQWKISNKVTLMDTPGIVPENRLSDRVCVDCARKLVPARAINVKVYELAEHQGLVIPGLAAVKVEGSAMVILGFTASEVSWQRANHNKFEYWLGKRCADCPQSEWITHEVTIPSHHDLAIHGLGWISVRRTEVKCALTIPANVAFSVRPNLVGARKKR